MNSALDMALWFYVAVMLACVLALAFCFLMLARNDLVYQVRAKAIDIIWDSKLDESVFDDGPTYDAMMWDFRKWTFKQFYPELADKVTP